MQNESESFSILHCRAGAFGSAASSARLRRFAFSAKNTCYGGQKRRKASSAT
jgi:hypothetical protein